MQKKHFLAKFIIIGFISAIVPILSLAGTFHTCVHFSSADDHCFTFAGNCPCACYHTDNFVFKRYVLNQEKPCLACQIERQGTPNQPVVSINLTAPLFTASSSLPAFAYAPQALSCLQETRAPPLAI